MPELPEVEIVRRGLSRLVVSRKIVDLTVDRPALFPQGVDEVKTWLIGQTIENIQRRGKYLLFRLSHGTLISHLRMEGKFLLYDQEVIEDKHIHARFYLDDGHILVYRDVRVFGRFHYAPTEQDVNEYLQKLGPEPTEESLDEGVMYDQLHKARTAIKTVLLNQKIVAGLGNIYVDEVLFQSHILPTRPAYSLTKEEVHQLRRQIIDVLADATNKGGSTIRTYKNAFGDEGQYQHYLQVYGKENTPCPQCGTPIEKIKVGGRGTHFCPHCQR